jgi:hypothetical protein
MMEQDQRLDTTESDDIVEDRDRPGHDERFQGRDLSDANETTDREFEQGSLEPLLPPQDVESLRGRWTHIHERFVDEPRRSVEEADRVVTDLITRLARSFAEERSRLENQWDRGTDVSTEDLRQALQHYRSFFERLMAA